MHEMKVVGRDMNTGAKYELPRSAYQSDIQFLRKQEGIADSVISVLLRIPAHHELVL